MRIQQNIKADLVKTVVFNLYQVKRRDFLWDTRYYKLVCMHASLSFLQLTWYSLSEVPVMRNHTYFCSRVLTALGNISCKAETLVLSSRIERLSLRIYPSSSNASRNGNSVARAGFLLPKFQNQFEILVKKNTVSHQVWHPFPSS